MSLPSTRKLKKLSEICVIDPKKSLIAHFSNDTKVSFIPMKDLSQEHMLFEVNEEKKLGDVRKGYTYFENNDVLLAKVTPCFENGKCGIAKNLTSGIGFGSSEFIVLRKSKEVNETYLYYFVASKAFRQEGAENMSGAVGLQRVQKVWLENKKLPLPPLPTQHAIVAKLDAVQAEISEAKQAVQGQINTLDALWQSSLSEIFERNDWEQKKLSEVCIIERGGSPRPIEDFLTNDETGINWIKIGDTKNQTKYITYTQEKIKSEGVKRSRMVYPGDFILSNSMSFGKPYIMQIEGCIHDGRLVLRPDENIDKDFMYHLLGSPFMYTKFEQTAAGTGVKNLNIHKVKEIQIPLPSLSEQESIVAKLDALSIQITTLRTDYQAQLQQYDELWASTLDKAFKGELVK